MWKDNYDDPVYRRRRRPRPTPPPPDLWAQLGKVFWRLMLWLFIFWACVFAAGAWVAACVREGAGR